MPLFVVKYIFDKSKVLHIETIKDNYSPDSTDRCGADFIVEEWRRKCHKLWLLHWLWLLERFEGCIFLLLSNKLPLGYGWGNRRGNKWAVTNEIDADRMGKVVRETKLS